MSLHSRFINGNLVFWQGHRRRFIDALGQNVSKYLADFSHLPLAGADNPSEWTVTLVEAGAGESTVALATVAGGELLITTDAADNDGVNMQVSGEAFQPATDEPIYFGVELETDEATQSDLFVGLAVTDTDLLGGVTDGIYFECLDASTDINFVTEQDSTETTSATAAGTLADATKVILEFYYDGAGNVEYFVNGTSQGTSSTNVPDDEVLTPSIHFLTGEVAAHTLNVSWLRCIQIR